MIEVAIKDRIVRLLGRALIDIGWDRHRTAADSLEQALFHLRELAALDIKGPEPPH